MPPECTFHTAKKILAKFELFRANSLISSLITYCILDNAYRFFFLILYYVFFAFCVCILWFIYHFFIAIFLIVYLCTVYYVLSIIYYVFYITCIFFFRILIPIPILSILTFFAQMKLNIAFFFVDFIFLSFSLNLQ